MEYEDTQISKYNDANLSILRLNDMWIHCRQYIKTGNFKAWKTELDNIWLELYVDVMRNQKSNFFILKNNVLMANISQAKTRTQLYFALTKRHQFLRHLQDKSGKAGVYGYENTEGFEEA